MTTILAALGGLTKALHFVVSWLALLVFAIFNWKKRNQVIPQSDIKVVDVDGHAPEVVDVNDHAPEVIDVDDHAPEVVDINDHAPEVVISNPPVTTVEVISFYFA
jgi:hypothetical protein